jgi:2-aminoethylphosphonate-pyruvate transaminase
MTDKPLFTPGPLTTSASVKAAMQHDLGSRDEAFLVKVREIRQRLLSIGQVSTAVGYEAVLMQGSGTFGLESVVGSAMEREGTLLVLVNGAYGTRLAHMSRVLGITTEVLEWAPNEVVDVGVVDALLRRRQDITTVAVVHGETTAGIVNPVANLGRVVKSHGRRFLVDAMSSFGALPLHLLDNGIDFLVSSANKCIEGVPGFTFILCERTALLACAGRARSLSLDLYAQWKGFEDSGQFRFTPPTHALLAFHQALLELEEEGGPSARLSRYHRVQQQIVAGMRRLGFRTYLPDELQGPIITSFAYPTERPFVFESFYKFLNERGFVIYPGKVANVEGFRIGSIGRLSTADVNGLLSAVEAFQSLS